MEEKGLKAVRLARRREMKGGFPFPSFLRGESVFSPPFPILLPVSLRGLSFPSARGKVFPFLFKSSRRKKLGSCRKVFFGRGSREVI